MPLDLRRSICPPANFARLNFTGDDAERRVREELLVLRPREVLFASSLPLFDQVLHCLRSHQPTHAGWRRPQSAAAPRPAWRRWRMRIWAETPLDDWVFAPDYAIPQVENHFGVLSLEGFGLANRAAAATAAGAILHYVRTTQRGSLDHVDRIGFYERQNCLVLDAVTVRNLELIEPLFAGAGDNATLFRCLDCTVTPMGKRLLRAWMLRPSIDAGRNRRAAGRGREHGQATSSAREELRRVAWTASSIWSGC